MEEQMKRWTDGPTDGHLLASAPLWIIFNGLYPVAQDSCQMGFI
jgi:hypothetical protein